MTIEEVISGIDRVNEEAIIYAKKIDGKFLSSSEVVLVLLPEEEQDLPTSEIAGRYCPGFDYFLEGFMIKEMVQDIQNIPDYRSLDKQVSRVIHYAEFDA